MKKISEFYWQADKFRLMAKREKSAEQKAVLTNMANTWEGMAKDREAELMMQRLAKSADASPADALAPSSSDEP